MIKVKRENALGNVKNLLATTYWLSHCTLSNASVLKVVYEMAMFSRFYAVPEEDLEILLDNPSTSSENRNSL